MCHAFKSMMGNWVVGHKQIKRPALYDVCTAQLLDTCTCVYRRINYWVNFVENNPIPGVQHPHAIAIASHRDELRKRYPKEYNAQISALEGFTRSRFKCSGITLDGFFALNCRCVVVH